MNEAINPSTHPPGIRRAAACKPKFGEKRSYQSRARSAGGRGLGGPPGGRKGRGLAGPPERSKRRGEWHPGRLLRVSVLAPLTPLHCAAAAAPPPLRSAP